MIHNWRGRWGNWQICNAFLCERKDFGSGDNGIISSRLDRRVSFYSTNIYIPGFRLNRRGKSGEVGIIRYFVWGVGGIRSFGGGTKVFYIGRRIMSGMGNWMGIRNYMNILGEDRTVYYWVIITIIPRMTYSVRSSHPQNCFKRFEVH